MRHDQTTFLDDPATPAPVFAYRALRGLIFGSPDPNTSPERDARHNDKENVSPQRLGRITEGPKKGTYTPEQSPAKRKRGNEPPPLSPAKGLTIPLSPTKGILRTPGISTPRAKALRDVNVKFRSLSPELRRKDVKHEIVLEDVKARQKTVTTDERRTKKARTASESTIKQDEAITDAPARPTSIPEADFQNYERRTQKEMKMIIKQGQKWREYARLQDEENAKLRQLLEQAQKENERLERKLRLMERDRQTSTSVQAMEPGAPTNSSNDTARALKKLQTTLTAPAQPVFPSRSISESLETRLSQLRQTSAPCVTTQALPSRPPKPQPSVSASFPKPPFNTYQTEGKKPAAPSPLTALARQLEPEPSPHTSTRTNLPPERYSAARERLRQRQQTRKASGLGQVAEESGVDWVGLG